MKFTRLALILGTLVTAAACGEQKAAQAPSAPTPVETVSGSYTGPEVSPSGERYLTVASWGSTYQDVQRKIYFTPFSQKLGQPVVDKVYEGGYHLLLEQVQSGDPKWDLVQVEAEELERGCAEGIFEPLDWSKLGLRENYVNGAASDCGVGNMVYSTLLTYDADKLKTAPTSWADFWDTKKYPGKRGLRKGPKYTLEFALLADGVEPHEVYKVLATPEGVDRAFKKLDVLKPNIVWWEGGAQPLDDLASDRVTMAATYSGRVPAFNITNKRNLKVVWPQSIYAIDSWAILKNAKNKEAAMDLIAFSSEPDNQAQLAANNIAYGLPNKIAAAKVPLDFAQHLPTTTKNLPNTIPLNIPFWTANSEQLTQKFNAWLGK